MKRKLKIFSAIGSLCLAVALMAFGVYAATSVTYTVSGTVSYTVSDVYVDINASYGYVTGEKVGHTIGSATTEANDALTNGGLGGAVSLTEFNSYSGTDATNPGGTINDTTNNSVNINFATSTVWVFNFVVTSALADPQDLVVDVTTTAASGNVVYTANVADDTIDDTDGNTKTYTVVIALADASLPATGAYSISLNITLPTTP